MIAYAENPLAIYLLWHPACKEANALAGLINQHFNDFGMTWSGQGESVPVRVRFQPWDGSADGAPRRIDFGRAETNLIVAFAENRMLAAASRQWQPYLEELRGQAAARGNRDRLLVLSLSGETLFFEAWGARLNAERVHAWAEKWESPEFNTRLLTSLTMACVRQLHELGETRGETEGNEYIIPSKTTIFISHAKSDGDAAAQKFKKRLENNPFGLSGFYDTIDLEAGRAFDAQFEARLQQAALLVLETEAYHGRAWCEREALLAKRNQRPMLVVDMIRERVRRTSCHLGNALLVRAGEEQLTDALIDKIILELVSEVMREAIWRRRSASAARDGVVLSVRPPEACDALFYNECETIFLYPDPPAMEAQAEFFRQLGKFRAMTWAQWESRQQ